MTNDNPRGLPVAWRIKWSPDFPESDELLSDGERLIACQALDNPPYIDALVLATDYAALQADLAAAIARAEAWKQAFTIERQRLYISQGMKIEQARIHAENDAAIAAQQAEGES